MAISHIGTNHATSANGTSVTVTKPASTTQGDIMLAFFTSNNQDCTPPAGWTEIADEVIEVFRCQVFRKVAGGSEPANYAFSVGAAAPLVGTITTLRGGDDANPIDIAAVAETDLGHTEGYTTPSITGGTAGRLVYFRSVRLSGTTPPTFTASGVTELKDIGVFSGGSVCYSQGLYLANSDYSGSGVKSGLSITCSGTESHNFVFTVGIKSEAGVTASMAATIPSIPSVAITGSWAYAASLSAAIPMPTMTGEAFSGNFEGPVEISVPVTVTLAGHTDVRGSVSINAGPIVNILGETRFFGDNSVVPEREERWFIITQEGYYLGVRTGIDLPMRIEMPLPVVNIAVTTATRAGQVPDVPVVAFEPTEVVVAFSAGTAPITGTAYAATVTTGRRVDPEPIIVEISAVDEPGIRTVFTAETVVATAEASNVIGASVLVNNTNATVTAYSPTVGNAKVANADHVSVSAVANAPQSGVANASAGHASVSVTTNQGTEKVTLPAGHASINCHN